MRLFLVVFFLSLSINIVNAQTTTDWFPANLNIQPFAAHFLEPKTGFQYLFDLEKVRIDIGTSQDIIHWVDNEHTFSLGADFFYLHQGSRRS